jgi:hypothetical protein
LIESLNRVTDDAFQALLSEKAVWEAAVVFDPARFDLDFELLLKIFDRQPGDRLAALNRFEIFNFDVLLQFASVVVEFEFYRGLIFFAEKNRRSGDKPGCATASP